MLFASMVFLWVFLPTVIILNAVLTVVKFKSESTRVKAKNILLLIASFVFYAWGGVYYLLIMVFSIIINYVCGRIIDRQQKRQKISRGNENVAEKEDARGKAVLAVTIILNLTVLFFFKYFNMLIVVIENIMSLISGENGAMYSMVLMKGTGALGLKEIVLPIGISFFTFQAMSYVIDVYTGKANVQENIVSFALYVALFPQLIAGPIVKYSDVAEQIDLRSESLGLFASGQKRFCYGLGKKVLLANTFAQAADSIWKLDVTRMGSGVAWLGALAYMMQIYYDFSGYSDMAIGLGRMFGFRFKENFNYPYTAVSVQDFWRRWHISLSSWFKEYVYIPLGGNRKGNGRTYLNVFIVFLLTGIWHGANFTFLAWGIFYAILQIIERLFLRKVLDKNPIKPLNWLYTMIAVIVGWVLFRSDNIVQAAGYLKTMFSFAAGDNTVLEFLSMKLLMASVAAVIGMGFVARLFSGVIKKLKKNAGFALLDIIYQMALLMLSIMAIAGGTYNPFIYFQF